MKNTYKKIIKAAEALDWAVYHNFVRGTRAISFEFEKYSPAGEDFSFYCESDSPDGMIEEIESYSADFDTEEHIEMLIEAKRNGFAGVPSIRELVKDADAIENMLRELAEAVTYGVLVGV